jgi:hypothetical protein
MGGADGALWARIALCGWRGSASFGHPPRKGGVGGPEIVIERSPAGACVCGCVWRAMTPMRVACWRGRPRIAVSAVGRSVLTKSGASADARDERTIVRHRDVVRSCPFSVRSAAARAALARARCTTTSDELRPPPPGQWERVVPGGTAVAGSDNRNKTIHRNTKPTESKRSSIYHMPSICRPGARPERARRCVRRWGVFCILCKRRDGRDERHDTERSTASNSFSHLPVGCGDAERKFDLEQPRRRRSGLCPLQEHAKSERRRNQNLLCLIGTVGHTQPHA